MKFAILSRTELEVTAETQDEVRATIKHFNLDPFQFAEAFALGRLVHVTRLGSRDNPGYFAVETLLDESWLAPYMEKLNWITGYEGPPPEIDNFPVDPRGWPLVHTHQITGAKLGEEGLWVQGIQWSQDWNGWTAETRAPIMFAEYVREDMGDRKHEPEYIGVGHGGGGLLKHNPNYLKRHYPHPAATNARAFEALLQWWLATHANETQREVAAKALACHRTVCKNDTLGEWLLRSYEPFWRLDWEGNNISFADWQALK